MSLISSTILVPELQYYFGYFVKSSRLNKYQINIPATFSETIVSPASFIQLLFDDNWPSIYTSYKYCYREITDKSQWPSALRDRLCLYSQSAKYYVLNDINNLDSTSTNIFQLKQDDIKMLDKLLEYRLDGTSVTLVDIDSTALSTNLSILIYRYLDLRINNNYQLYNNTTLIANLSIILEVSYEAYLIEKMFLYISDKGT
jgi:hypothetical protein